MNRKKLLSAIFIFAIIAFTINSSNAQHINLAVKGGYNISDVSGNYPVETKLKSGFNFYVSKDIINFLAITVSGEAGYTQKGFDVETIVTNEFGVETGRGVIHYKLNYIDLSVLGKVRIPGGVDFPYLLAGPSLGIKVSSGVSSSLSDSSSLSQLNPFLAAQEPFLKDFSTTSFGFKFGIGVEIGMPLITILAEARYNPDITTSYDKNNLKLKNKVYEFLVGVKF